MRSGYKVLAAAGVGITLLMISQGSSAQGVPSQADIGRALRPIPQALLGGHQGLPTIGHAGQTDPVAASWSHWGRRLSPHTSGRLAHNAASEQRQAVSTILAPHLPGCPPQTNEAAAKPAFGYPVEFEFGSAVLKPQALEILRNLGKALNQDLEDQKLFVIQGHTDAVGTIAYNEELSRARAEAVKSFLIHEMGVTADRLEAVGKAYCEPANPRNPRGAENRRVVVINHSS